MHLYAIVHLYALLTPRDSTRFIWKRSANNSNKIGTTIPIDLDVEDSNYFIKQAIKNFGHNVTEKAFCRIRNKKFRVCNKINH